MSVNLLTEHNLKLLTLKGGCTGSSEYTLVKIPHCWKSHVEAHIIVDFHSMDALCMKISLANQKSMTRKCHIPIVVRRRDTKNTGEITHLN